MKPFIYALSDPLEPGHFRYIGLAMRKARRPYDHKNDARKTITKETTYVIKWVRKLQSEGRDYRVSILEEFPEGTSFQIVCEAEIGFIAAAKVDGHNLTNLTDGGDGSLNLHPSVRARLRAFNLGRTMSEASRELISKARRGKPLSEEHRAKISASAKLNDKQYDRKSVWTEERRQEARDRNLGKKRSEESRKKTSQSLRESHSKMCVERKEKIAEKISKSITDVWARRQQ